MGEELAILVNETERLYTADGWKAFFTEAGNNRRYNKVKSQHQCREK
jgi:hypothetical protein